MTGPFLPETFSRRRDRLRAELGRNALVLASFPTAVRSGDSEYPYRGDGNVFYLTGFREPDCVVVLLGDAHDRGLVVFLRDRDATQEQWTGRRLGVERAPEALGADRAFSITELEDRLPVLLRDVPRVYYQAGHSEAADRAIRSALLHGRTRGTRTGTGTRATLDPGILLEPMRRVKDTEEVEALRAVCALTVSGLQAALAAVAPGVGEWAVQAEAEAIYRRGRGAAAFATIVGGGENGCILHYVENESVLESGDLVLMDSGADLNMYCGDITRTVPVGGSFTGAQKEVFDAVAAAKVAAEATIRPGVPVADVHAAAVRSLCESLVAMGVLSGDPDQLASDGAVRPWFPHNTSHWLGIDVHDVGTYARDGDPVLLEPGMVLTIEPGLYFMPGAEGVPDHLAGIGVRLEDDWLVTSEGGENLTGDLPLLPDPVR
jgi:Xaa-Pro aminopeptidase